MKEVKINFKLITTIGLFICTRMYVHMYVYPERFVGIQA